jgi:hypothetical protein
MRVVEDRACGHAELVITIFAIEQLLRRRQFDCRRFASQAFNAAGPAKPDKKFAALFVGVEQVYNVN